MSGKMTLKDIRDKLDGDTLDLSLCDLEEVPVKEISTIKRFSHLDLSNNALTTLPKNFATLTQIVKLDLSKNMLVEIPENFGELKQLRHLDLYSNKISRLPLSLGELKNLKWLDLKENPLTAAVASTAGPCSNASECQACARKIVAYLANVKTTVDEEKQRRLTAIQEVEKTVATSKKEAKKKKKNAEKKAEKDKTPNAKKEQPQEKNNVTKSPKSKTTSEHKSKSNDNSQAGVSSLICRAFISLILWSIFFFLVILTVIAILPIYNKKFAEHLFWYVETQTGIPINDYYREVLLETDLMIHYIKIWTNRTREFIEEKYLEYLTQEKTAQEKQKF